MKRATEEATHQAFFGICREASQSSSDRDTQVGCVVVKGSAILVRGCNTFPEGLNDPTGERSVRPGKYEWI